MNKKIIALVMAIALCLSCTAALAAGSKTTRDIVSIPPTVAEPVVIVTQPTAETKAILTEIAELANSDTSVAEYFGITANEAAAELKVDELVPVVVVAPETRGSVTFTLSTAAAYSKADKPVVMLGVMVNGELVWTELEYEIIDGELVVIIPAALIDTMADGSANIAVLSIK